ncbi:MAG: ABC transporter permease [Oscillospiraceae bacterium]|jgi:spermidine/putrescine transport system permease protein|nr:ABC transporter permease [Oscillospiraceae bacterium]
MKIRQAPRAAYIMLILALMYLPIAVVIVFSFSASGNTVLWTGATFDWYRKALHDTSMLNALLHSVIIGLTASVLAAIIGTSAAVGVVTRKPPAAGAAQYVATLPIMVPEIVFGIAFFMFVSLVRIPLGFTALLIAHTSFCVPYVYLLVKARLAGMPRSYEEAARDLGATGLRAFFDVTLPMISPAILSGMLLSFAMSFDDVIISAYLTSQTFGTLPGKLLSIKAGNSETRMKAYALTAMIFAVTLLFAAAFGLITRTKSRRVRV